MLEKIQRYSKFIVAVLGAVAAGGTGLIPDEALNWLPLVISVLTAVGVYVVPNKDDLPVAEVEHVEFAEAEPVTASFEPTHYPEGTPRV